MRVGVALVHYWMVYTRERRLIQYLDCDDNVRDIALSVCSRR